MSGIKVGDITIDAEQVQKYQMLNATFAEVDKHPKNVMYESEEKDPYKRMCMCLAQGYEMDKISPTLSVNEFGKPESISSFEQRHPNFAEDIQQVGNLFSTRQ